MALICDDIVHLKMIVVFICLSFFFGIFISELSLSCTNTLRIDEIIIVLHYLMSTHVLCLQFWRYLVPANIKCHLSSYLKFILLQFRLLFMCRILSEVLFGRLGFDSLFVFILLGNGNM